MNIPVDELRAAVRKIRNTPRCSTLTQDCDCRATDAFADRLDQIASSYDNFADDIRDAALSLARQINRAHTDQEATR